jgi:hypothetical protein
LCSSLPASFLPSHNCGSLQAYASTSYTNTKEEKTEITISSTLHYQVISRKALPETKDDEKKPLNSRKLREHRENARIS